MTVDSERLLDGVGWRILQELQQDGRISFTELGRRVNLSLPAVAERVRRMEETGIITGYHAAVELEKLNLPITAFIRISTSREGCAQVKALAAECPDIRECYRVTGSDSYIMKVAVPSITALESLIDRLMPFGSPSTSIVLSSPVVKHVFEREDRSIGPQISRRIATPKLPHERSVSEEVSCPNSAESITSTSR